jgi:hypothetical protein
MENKKTAVELLEAHLIEYGFDLSLHKFEINQAKEMEKQQIIDAYNQKICLHLDKEFVNGVFGGYWCPKCKKNVDSELEQD